MTDPLAVRHRPWSGPPRLPRMSNDEDVRPGLSLTSRHLTRDGVPVVPVSGELHYSRVPRVRWARRLRQMRAGGVTVVASYVIWLHHVEHRGAPRFDGNLDVAAFVDECAAAGLDVILRLGPWVHGETRNGGFPDWVQQAPVRHRTDDPAYLDLVRAWFAQIATALDGRCGPRGTVLGIQLENELYDQPGHLVTLKRLAREAGMSAPLWTATAWGGADLPAEEVLPLYGGYGDGFWVDADAPWDPTFRDHYFFSHVWDDPGIGADVRRLRSPAGAVHPRTPSDLFPPATCELGGGMATAYHRRPRPAARDVAAIAHCKIGNGSAWQGYYMYAGGTNPPGDDGMQESHATGYPNDLPRLGYDFHAPIGEAGMLAPSHAELRRQHAFLAAFGDRLAEMPSSLPVAMPAGVEDDRTLRWALRSDGDSGFLFIAWHQPHFPLPAYRGAQFRVCLDDGLEVVLPSRPVDIPAGTLARWPLRFRAGGVQLDWVTASALTLLPGPVPTLVVVADAGIAVEYAVSGSVRTVEPGPVPERVTTAGGALDLLVLPAAWAAAVWVAEGRVLLCEHDLCWGPDGGLEAQVSGVPRALAYEPGARTFVPVPMVLAGGFSPALSSAHPETDRPFGLPEGGVSADAGGQPSMPPPAETNRLVGLGGGGVDRGAVAGTDQLVGLGGGRAGAGAPTEKNQPVGLGGGGAEGGSVSETDQLVGLGEAGAGAGAGSPTETDQLVGLGEGGAGAGAGSPTETDQLVGLGEGGAGAGAGSPTETDQLVGLGEGGAGAGAGSPTETDQLVGLGAGDASAGSPTGIDQLVGLGGGIAESGRTAKTDQLVGLGGGIAESGPTAKTDQLVGLGERAAESGPTAKTDQPVGLGESSAQPGPVAGLEAAAGVELVRSAGDVPITYGKYDGRPSAPANIDDLAAVYRLTLPDWAAELDTVLRIDWAGDAGRLEIDGRAVTDRFWDGSAWLVNLRDVGYRAGATVTLHLLPLATASPVALPHDARDRLIAAEGQLLAVDGIRVLGLATYREVRA